jgi:hypothetical protein
MTGHRGSSTIDVATCLLTSLWSRRLGGMGSNAHSRYAFTVAHGLMEGGMYDEAEDLHHSVAERGLHRLMPRGDSQLAQDRADMLRGGAAADK